LDILTKQEDILSEKFHHSVEEFLQMPSPVQRMKNSPIFV